MTISAFDLFKVGIGPSSSHTVGPMRAACSFARRAFGRTGLLARVARVRCELFGSLGATGHGHGSVKAVVLGLEGEQPDSSTRARPARGSSRSATRASCRWPASTPSGSPSTTTSSCTAASVSTSTPTECSSSRSTPRGPSWTGASTTPSGGGFVLDEDEAGNPVIVEDSTPVRYPFHSGEELLAHARESGLRISDIMLANELSWRTEAEVRDGPAAHLGGDAGVRRARAAHPRRASRRPEGPQARRRAPRAARGQPGRHRPAAGDGVGDPLRAGGERGERRGRPRRHGTDQRRRRDRAGRAALLP